MGEVDHRAGGHHSCERASGTGSVRHQAIGRCGTSNAHLLGSSEHACGVGHRSLSLAHRKASSSLSCPCTTPTSGGIWSVFPGMPQAHPPSSRQKSGDPHGFLLTHMALLPSRDGHVIKMIVKRYYANVKNENRPTEESLADAAISTRAGHCVISCHASLCGETEQLICRRAHALGRCVWARSALRVGQLARGGAGAR